MLRRLINALRRKSAEADRQIFRYCCAGVWRCADPVTVLLALKEDPELLLDLHPNLALAEDLDAARICAAAARRAFGLPTIDPATGSGVTDMEAAAVLFAFGHYMKALKKNSSSSQTLPPTSGPSSPAASTTKAASDCGSTAQG